jgi:hypothetical protein
MRLVFPIAESPTMPTFMTTLLQKEEALVQVDQEEESNHPTNDPPSWRMLYTRVRMEDLMG